MAEVNIPRVKLGTQGLEVSKLGYGCMNLSVSEEDGIAILKYAFSKGVTFFDSSDVYDHANEILLGRALKELPREKIELATKFGIVKVDTSAAKLIVKGIPEYVLSCCEASLRRLGVDYIDLFYVHCIDTSIPIEDTVSKLGYGCMGLSGMYNLPVSEEDGIAIIKYAFSRGITFFDTSDVYGADHANEILVGKALKELPREKIELATKFGIVKFDVNAAKVIVNGTPEYVRSCCESSLRRLGVDYIDLYYVHRIDTSTPIEETMGELKRLVEEGKIKYIGLSEASPDTIRRAHAVHPISALQMEYSLLTRDIEEDIIPVCRELGIGIVPYAPTARGFFGGKAAVDSVSANSILSSHPRFSGSNLEQNKILYNRVEALARKHGCSPVQLALSWVLHQGDDMVPIPGTTKRKNLDENIGAVKVKLNEVDLKEIYDAVPVNEVAGARIGEALLRSSYKFADTPLLKEA